MWNDLLHFPVINSSGIIWNNFCHYTLYPKRGISREICGFWIWRVEIDYPRLKLGFLLHDMRHAISDAFVAYESGYDGYDSIYAIAMRFFSCAGELDQATCLRVSAWRHLKDFPSDFLIRRRTDRDMVRFFFPVRVSHPTVYWKTHVRNHDYTNAIGPIFIRCRMSYDASTVAQSCQTHNQRHQQQLTWKEQQLVWKEQQLLWKEQHYNFQVSAQCLTISILCLCPILFCCYFMSPKAAKHTIKNTNNN